MHVKAKGKENTYSIATDEDNNTKEKIVKGKASAVEVCKYLYIITLDKCSYHEFEAN